MTNQNGEVPGGICEFASGGYQIAAPIYSENPCLYTPSIPADIAIEVTVKLVMGVTAPDAQAGIVFREDQNVGGYYFGFNAAGDYTFDIVFLGITEGGTTLPGLSSPQSSSGPVPSPYLHQGYGSSNTLAISVQGSAIDGYINGHYIGAVTDNTFQQGHIGLVVSSGSLQPNAASEAVFSNLTVWQLP